MKKAITLLSGGLDSMVSTAITRKKHKVVLALTFDYGQRAARREIEVSGKFCKLWKIPHKVIKLPWLAEITNTALVNKNISLPVFNDRPTVRSFDRTTKTVWVPNRNSLFVNIAASFAEALGAGLIITGFNKEEGVVFPDNSKKFVSAVNNALKYSTLQQPKSPHTPLCKGGTGGISVKSFVQDITKAEMVKYAVKNKLPISLCWPCYEGGKRLCGQCESCARFLNALKKV